MKQLSSKAAATSAASLTVLEDQSIPSRDPVVVGAQLDAPGLSDPVDTSANRNHKFNVTVANINTSVTVRILGADDGTNYGNIASDGTDFVITANGTYPLSRSNYPMKTAKIQFVSEDGGTDAIIDTTYVGGN